MPDNNRGRPWSETDVYELRGRLEIGSEVDDIAEFLCRDVEEVRLKARQYGLYLNPTASSRQIIICGHAIDTADILAHLIRGSASTPVEISLGKPLADITPVEGRTIVTHDTRDLFLLKPLFRQLTEPARETRIILIMRDPRDLLLLRNQEAGGEFAQGYDHTLHVSDSGVVTFSDSGILHTQTVLEANAARYGSQALVVRHEDLEQRPDWVQSALARFTGLDFVKPFAALLENDARWATTVKTQPVLELEDVERIVRQFRLAPALFDILERWKYTSTGDRRWYDELARSAPAAFDDTPGTIIGFYTAGTRYEHEAARLTNSIRRLGLALELVAIEPQGDWRATVRRKPGLLLDLRKRLRGPLLYVDVDAVVHRDPWPYLRGYRGDVAVSGHKGDAIVSGTLLLNDTLETTHFIEAWISATERSPEAPGISACLEMVVLAHRLGSGSFRIQYLPTAMCRVFDRHYNPPVEPIIEHLQASRERFADSGDADHQANLARRRQRVAELDGLFAAEPPMLTAATVEWPGRIAEESWMTSDLSIDAEVKNDRL